MLYLLNISFISLLLPSCLSYIPLLIGLPYLRGLPTRVFFLPYAYRVVVFCLFLILLLFVFLFRVNYVSSVILPSEDVFC